MKLKNCCLLFLFFTFSVVAQQTGTFLTYEITPSVEDVDGSPYINSVFLPAKVIGVTEISGLMRYNAEKDEMEFTKEGRNYHLYKSDSLEIRMVNTTYRYLQYETSKSMKNGYLVVLLERGKENKHSLYKKQAITLVPKAQPKSSYDQPKKAHYRIEEDKFFISVSDRIVPMPKKKKELLALTPNNTAEIESYLKTNKVNFEDEKNLIDLVKFMNTLK